MSEILSELNARINERLSALNAEVEEVARFALQLSEQDFSEKAISEQIHAKLRVVIKNRKPKL